MSSSQTGLTFDSEVSAFEWAKNFANDHMFNIIRATKKSRKNMPGQFHHYFNCECAVRKERSESKEKRLESGLIGTLKKRLTSTKRVGCDFRGVIRRLNDGKFHVIITEGVHSHPLIYYVEGNANFTRLSETDKEKVREMHRAHCKPKAIADALQYSDDKKPFLARPIYNEIAKMNRVDAEGRNPAREFFQLARNRDYFVRHTVIPGTEQLKDLFWCHPNGLKMLRCYPNVFCIDATYSTNRYNYALVEIVGVAPTNSNFTAAQALLQREDKASYLWVMRCLEEVLGCGVSPAAIVTDRELGLFEPIETVFPESSHLLCMHHVKKMIRAKAITVMKSEKEADSLCNGAVRRMLEAPTLKKFYACEEKLRLKYGWVPGFIRYLDEIWLPHKEKICYAWTNQVRHYGNNTTNRVESAHSALKDWMSSCRGGVTTLFNQAHAEIESQTKSVRCKLEHSRSRNLDGFEVSPYMLLLRRVSHYCLKVLEAEFKKMGHCDHALWDTHGLPCRCRQEVLYMTGDFISTEGIDSFWTKLIYDGEAIEAPNCVYDIPSMVEDLAQRDPADQLRMGRVFHKEMYPEKYPFQQPAVNETKKGRPPTSKKKKTTRKLSAWEHVDNKYGTGTGRSSQASQTSQASQSSQTSQSSRASQASDSDVEKTMDEKLYSVGARDVPEYVREYLVDIDDVEGDGNCGFRCVALKFLNNADDYISVRQMLIAEMSTHHAVYRGVYELDKVRNAGDFEKALERIEWTGQRCSSAHWMQAHCDLFAIAQVFRSVVSVYSVDERLGCSTVFPWRGNIKSFSKLREISIIYRSSRLHFVLGHFSTVGVDPDQPLPSVHPCWRGIRDRSLRVWEEKTYAPRINRFNHLQQIYYA